MTSQDASHLKATIAANLDRGITAKRLTNREVGLHIGKSEMQVWKWRRARHTPSLESLVALAALLFDGNVSEFYVDHDPRPIAA